MNIGVMLPNWIGDVVMATPALHALRQTFGDTVRITGVLRPYVAPILEGSNYLDDAIPFDPRHASRKLHSGSVARELRRRKFDLLLLLTNSLRAAMIAWWSGAGRRIGYARNGRSLLLTDRLHAPRDATGWTPLPAIDAYLAIAQRAGCSTSDRRMRLVATADEQRLADQVAQRLELSDDLPLFVLNTGGAKGAAKDWPESHFIELARRLADQYHAQVLVLCGPAEREKARAIQDRARRTRVLSLADPRLDDLVSPDVSLGLAKALVKRSSLMVTTDSGPRHFAHAFDVPVVVLYGPNDPAWTTPYHDRSRHLYTEMDCRPCGERICPLGHHDCMQQLTPARVLQTVAELLREQRSGAA